VKAYREEHDKLLNFTIFWLDDAKAQAGKSGINRAQHLHHRPRVGRALLEEYFNVSYLI